MKFAAIKAATVAIARVHNIDQQIFEIVGSGVCIDRRGIIVTCQHVISAFMSVSIPDQVKRIGKADQPRKLNAPPLIIPHAIFYKVDTQGRLIAFPCRVDQMLAATDQDIGAIRVLPHIALPEGYPTVTIEDYDEIHEGLEIATCGFPLGNFLQKQIGTVTSSFTFGRVSSVCPYEGIERKNVHMFQLDLTATHGNSGGPVFSVASQKVIGILQGGILHTSGELLPGLVRCEPVYKFVNENVVEFLKSRPPGELGNVDDMRKLKP